jgi:hypothetical protein
MFLHLLNLFHAFTGTADPFGKPRNKPRLSGLVSFWTREYRRPFASRAAR